MQMEKLYQEIILDHYRAPHHYGLRDPFEAQVHHVNPTCGDEVTHGKPAPDIFLLAAHRLGVPAAGCLVLEDSEPGAQAARTAGMTPILVPDLKPPSPEGAALAYRVLPSLHDVKELLEMMLLEQAWPISGSG